MNCSINRVLFAVLALFLVLPSTTYADAAVFPYGCPDIAKNDGYRSIYLYQQSCSLRQAPERISDCKKGVESRETSFFEPFEKSVERDCYNKNGFVRTTTCVLRNTWETTGPSATWSYQTVKAYLCYYK